MPNDRRPTPPRRRTFAGWALAAALLPAATPRAASALQEAGEPVHVSPRFRFHSDFWLNLHHTLHAQARARLAFGLWDRGAGPRELEALRAEWQPWLDGAGSFREAVARVVRALAG